MAYTEIELAEKISIVAQKRYQQIKPSGKPTCKSNGVKEWTVLAAVVAFNNEHDEFRLISLATGVKALPDEELKRSQGRMVHDSHAEILAIRGLNTAFLRQIEMLDSDHENEKCDLIEETDSPGVYRFRSDVWKLALYVSKIPCGDCSMHTLNDQDHTGIHFGEEDTCQYIDPNVKTTLRGRFNYSKKGICRTKPGRADSNLTVSKSCSDKLLSKTVMSVLNAINWDLLQHPVYLDYLILPESNRELKLSCNRNFRERLASFPGVHPVNILYCKTKFNDDQNEEETKTPCPVSSILLDILPKSVIIEQCILNGVRNGCYVKGPKDLRKNSESVVSRLSQWQSFKKLKKHRHFSSYMDFKAQELYRNELKLKLRAVLSPDGWIHTRTDNFH
ncbi:HHL110Wp [Eremothecium sinecaudum]|uniref:HHL110Wp n=1 Tax=Eremothecium sinecaudum TaxID=45286 RepID=A0A0X8HWB2_9SACH|nr:HHL110Wp [Eremothecium sinecaudum]AMD22660.1 HHL110Wp [Eremothecium sinecaudum]